MVSGLVTSSKTPPGRGVPQEGARLTKLLDEGLDELAVATHAGLIPRLAVNVGTAWVFSLIIPWRICAIWLAVTLALEAQAWFATWPQARGKPVGWKRRLWHATSLAVSAVAWVTLGAVGWTAGGVDGALCASVLWLSVIFFSQTNAYQTPLGFVLGGVIPALAVLGVVLLAPHAPGLALARSSHCWRWRSCSPHRAPCGCCAPARS